MLSYTEMEHGIVERAVSSLGRGFDLTCDFRLKYCKGKERLVMLNEDTKKELAIPGFGVFKDLVSPDIKCDKGDRTRYQSDILTFNQMAELFNQKCWGPGKIPSGLFNAMFGFNSGSWGEDATKTKHLGVDGSFIVLFSLHIDRYPLLLSDEVRNAVPSAWDPCALARFIEKYGTHIIVGLGIGGEDVVLVRQDQSSSLEASELRQHLDELGDQLFSGSCNFSNSKQHKHKTRRKINEFGLTFCTHKFIDAHAPPKAFNVFDPEPISFHSFSSITTKDGITVICSKRGGDTSISSHCEWLPTVQSVPDAIQFNFIPITSLLKGVPGKGFLSHAINLYLRYKPPIADLQYFLDFQGHKTWAPIHNDLPMSPATNMATSSPSLNFNLMGPKLYVNTSEVIVGKRPVTGIRLFLEGMKCNRLAIHLQHLSNTPVMLENKIQEGIGRSWWRGSEQISADDDRFIEAIHRKKFSHVCTSLVKYDPKWSSRKDTTFIVTGAQLHVIKHDTKNVLHLRLLYSKVSHSFIVQSNWVLNSSDYSQKSTIFSAISTSIAGARDKPLPPQVVVDSSVFPNGPPVPVPSQKLVKFVDTSQLCRGPQDSPGHWLVTGARLNLDKGKICLHVKFSLLNICS